MTPKSANVLPRWLEVNIYEKPMPQPLSPKPSRVPDLRLGR